MAIFPVEKIADSWKPSEESMLELLQTPFELAPAQLRLITRLPGTRDMGIDALVEVAWGTFRETFAVQVKTVSQPGVLRRAADQVARVSESMQATPMVFVPYLSEDSLRELESQNVSGIDLGGNAVILGSAFRVWRSGEPNRFRESRTLQNPYRGDSSVFTRCFLLKPRFESLTGLREFALARSQPDQGIQVKPLQLGTASKVVQALADDLVIARDKDVIFLLDAKRLLANLERRYQRLDTHSLIGKTPLNKDEVWMRLGEWQRETKGRFVATGIGSASKYGVLFGDDLVRIYVDDLRSASGALQVVESKVFPNIELIEERKGFVYFDAQREGEAQWASPIQTWLELVQAGPREQEAAASLYDRILSSLRSEGGP